MPTGSSALSLDSQGRIVLDGLFDSLRWSLCHFWTQSPSLSLWSSVLRGVTQEACVGIKKSQDT